MHKEKKKFLNNMSKKKKNESEEALPTDDFYENDDNDFDDDFITPDFIEKIREFETKHNKIKLIKIHKLIGSPKILNLKQIRDDTLLVKEFNHLNELLTENNIYVHFKNEYPLREKYRFLAKEIMNQEVENTKDTLFHINFIYEDFYPDKDITEEDI